MRNSILHCARAERLAIAVDTKQADSSLQVQAAPDVGPRADDNPPPFVISLGPADDECRHADDTLLATVFGVCFACARRVHANLIAHHPRSTDWLEKQRRQEAAVLEASPPNWRMQFSPSARWPGARVVRNAVPGDGNSYSSICGRMSTSTCSAFLPCVADRDDPVKTESNETAPRHKACAPDGTGSTGRKSSRGLQYHAGSWMLATTMWAPLEKMAEVDHGPAGPGIDAARNLTDI